MFRRTLLILTYLFFIVLWVLSFLSFNLDAGNHFLSYDAAVVYGGRDGTPCYSPFAQAHRLTLNFFSFAFYSSVMLVWSYRKSLSPIMLTSALVFISIGVFIYFFMFVHLSVHDMGILSLYNNSHSGVLALHMPLNGIVGMVLIYKSVTQEIEKTRERRYQNKILDHLNNFMAKAGRNPLWLLILCLPVFVIVTLILTLFGQESTSIIKVFTETTTWRFSQHAFPPPIPDTSKGGHYLCTVAAAGDPKLVKPLRIGKRQGKMIVVNRQLLIANAFEELIQDFSPKIHRIIRGIYDKYGFDISKKINTVFWSNTVYLLMKPLEWFFLITLYLFCVKPEKKINAQYAIHDHSR